MLIIPLNYNCETGKTEYPEKEDPEKCRDCGGSTFIRRNGQCIHQRPKSHGKHEIVCAHCVNRKR